MFDTVDDISVNDRQPIKFELRQRMVNNLCSDWLTVTIQ